MATFPEPLAAFTFTGANLGASEQAKKEMRELRGTIWAPLFIPALAFLHRLRKWRAGAYQHRKLTTALYNLNSQTERQQFRHVLVGYSWSPEPLPVARSIASNKRPT